MDAVFDFLRAALPWIAVGLLLAVFFARSAGKKKKEKQNDTKRNKAVLIVVLNCPLVSDRNSVR